MQKIKTEELQTLDYFLNYNRKIYTENPERNIHPEFPSSIQ